MDEEIQREIEERFHQLPQIVQDAIANADIEKRLRTLSETHKLHVDAWDRLSNLVTLALLGISPVEKLPETIARVIKVDGAEAAKLADEINKIVFEPIREELERGLGSPQAKDVAVSDIETARTEAIAQEKASGAPVPVAATPPADKPVEKAARAVLSTAYAPAQPSHERKEIDGDPYREQVS